MADVPLPFPVDLLVGALVDSGRLPPMGNLSPAAWEDACRVAMARTLLRPTLVVYGGPMPAWFVRAARRALVERGNKAVSPENFSKCAAVLSDNDFFAENVGISTVASKQIVVSEPNLEGAGSNARVQAAQRFAHRLGIDLVLGRPAYFHPQCMRLEFHERVSRRGKGS